MRFDKVNTSTTGGVVSETNDIQLRWGSRVGAVGVIYGYAGELIIWNAQPTETIINDIESGMNNIW